MIIMLSQLEFFGTFDVSISVLLTILTKAEVVTNNIISICVDIFQKNNVFDLGKINTKKV